MKRDTSDPLQLARPAFLVFLLAIVFVFGWVVVRPLLAPCVLAVLAAVIFHPVHERVSARLKDRKTLAAAASIVLLSIFVAVPLGLFFSIFLVQVEELLSEALGIEAGDLFSSRMVEILSFYLEWVANAISKYTGESLDLRGMGMSAAKNFAQAVYDRLPDVLGFTGVFILNFLAFSIVLFFLFLEGPALLELLIELSPMDDRYDRQIFSRLSSMIQAVFMGGVLTAICQGTVGMLGLLIVGIDRAVVWGVLMAVCSLIPVVGTAIIWGPAMMYLWLDGHPAKAGVLLVFGITIGLMDNVVRPLFIKGRAGINPLLIFLGLFGGIQSVGPMGLIYGPLVAATVVEAVRIYRSDFLKDGKKPDAPTASVSKPVDAA
ncbi:MAG: AI-2E family transporter [Bdellovibrionota bacterium]